MLRSALATAALTTGMVFGAMSGAQAQQLVPCAQEHGYCRVPYPTRVIYGIPGRSTSRFVRGGGIPCTNEVFGDPAYGINKRCAFVAQEYGRRDRGYEGYRGERRGYGGYDEQW